MAELGAWEVDVAKNNRSTCEKCTQPIEASELRFQWRPPVKSERKFFHIVCAVQAHGSGYVPVNKNTVRKALGLSPSQRELLTAVLEAPTKAARAALLRAAQSAQCEDGGTGTAQGAAKRRAPEPRPSKQQRAQLKEAEPPSKKAPKAKLRTELHEFEKHRMKLRGWTTDKLKSLLKTNDQSRTGNKAVLLAKCADGEAFGKLPRCPRCHGGKIKFRLPGPDGTLQSLFHLYGGAYGKDKVDDQKEDRLRTKKRFYCTGFVDDDDKVECVWQSDKVARENWTSLG